MSLLEKMRKARESVIEVDGVRLTILRPTAADIADRPDGETTKVHLAYWSDFVVDWKGVKELDLVHGGGPDDVLFDRAAFLEWWLDRPEKWSDIITAIRDAYSAYRNKQQDQSKN